MTKVFKIIMNILFILLLAAMCAVFVPPFVGITTAVSSDSSESNIPTGAIVYATREALENLEIGENILITSDNSFYIYEITEIDEENRELTVRTSESSETAIVQLSRAATKVIIVIPLLGYILLAIQSFEGFIILSVTCAVIIILFIIATVMRNQAVYDEDDEDDLDAQGDDSQYFQELAEGASKPSELDKLGTFSMPEIDGSDAPKTREIAIDSVPSDEEAKEISKLMFGSADEVTNEPQGDLKDASKDSPADEQQDEPQENSTDEQNEISNADQIYAPQLELKDEPKVEPREMHKREPKRVGSVTAELLSAIRAFESSLEAERKGEAAPVSSSDTKEILLPPEIKAPEVPVKHNPAEVELAIPVRSLDDLLQEAYSRGEDPQVVKDEVTGISFVDYSSCF